MLEPTKIWVNIGIRVGVNVTTKVKIFSKELLFLKAKLPNLGHIGHKV